MSLLGLAETYLYANVLTQGALGGSPYAVVTGAADIAPIYNDDIYGNYSGTGVISLRDMIQNPNVALATVQQNVTNNLFPMMIQSAGIQIGFRLGKRLLRKPISATNRGLKMALGAGIRL
tara:strand:- start:38 stop:397 length:360 start_codon:yes stop_codon:yes gene_type:complete